MTTFSDILKPAPGRLLSFWTNRMNKKTDPIGITGLFDVKRNCFVTKDGADYYSFNEVSLWEYIGSKFKCQASGCPGCLVCE